MSSPAWNATLYDQKHAFVWEKARGVVELLAPQPGEHILDLGCGTGHLTAEIAATGAIVFGIDQSPEMIAQARANHPEIEFEVLDARELPFSQQFHAVFSNAVLHWIHEPEKVVRGIARTLKPGGRFVAEFGGKGNIQRLVNAIDRAFAKMNIPSDGSGDMWFYPGISEYASILEKHGLEVREASLFARPTKLDDGEKGLDTWLRMFGSKFLNRIPDERGEDLLREIQRQARPELFKSGVWELDYRRLRIAAYKTGANS